MKDRMLKSVAIMGVMLCALPLSSLADKPRVTPAMVDPVAGSLEGKLLRIWPNEQAEVVGVPQGVYLNGYGVVLMSKVNLSPVAGISPFHPSNGPDEVRRTHDKKVQRMDQLRNTMREMLIDAAATLDSVPPDEQIALGVSLFYWNWENRDGLPSQVVMHAPKKVLLQVKTGAAAKTSIVSEEF